MDAHDHSCSSMRLYRRIGGAARREDIHRMEMMDSLDAIAVFGEEAPRMLVIQNDAIDSG